MLRANMHVLQARTPLFVIPTLSEAEGEEPPYFARNDEAKRRTTPTAQHISPASHRSRYTRAMADQLYLSLWFPNFRLETLPGALVSVMRQFALISGGKQSDPQTKRVQAAAAYPISFSEAAVYQRLYVTDDRAEENQDTSASIIETAVAEATEILHDDMAYEFEMKWRLWTPDSGPGSPNYSADSALTLDPSGQLDTLWRPHPTTVKFLGFGPHFDDSSFEQNGHIRIDFGLDYPWVLDDEDDLDDDGEDSLEIGSRGGNEDSSDAKASAEPRSNLLSFNAAGNAEASEPLSEAAQYIQRNVEMLLAFTLSVEKHCGISSRLLWTESGEPLAEKLIARLQRLN